MFNKRGNSGSIPPNRLKTYGFPRTDFMRRNKRKDFIANINDMSLDIALNGEKIFKSEKEETQVIDLLEEIFNILSK